jgi:hypothetical protein
VLKQCTLVSSSFLLPSRKQLFSRIILKNDQTSQGIHHFLVENPVIQSFVRTIILTEDIDSRTIIPIVDLNSPGNGNPKSMNGKSLLAILRLPFCCLECFSIILHPDCPPNIWDWKYFSSDLKDALSNVIHSSTLKIFSLKGITNVPITVFLHIVHLTTLELHSISPINVYMDENSSYLTRAASKGMVPMASHAVIDQCIWSFGREQATWYENWYEIPFIFFFYHLFGTEKGRPDDVDIPAIHVPSTLP